jgi:DNA invertase Pin-like site-specific DNA recombinase
VRLRRAVIYARVSQDRSGNFRSVEEQISENKREVERHDDWYLGPIIRDDAISASRYATKDRKGYQELLLELREGDVLVIWEPSRAGRKLEDWVELRKLCETRGVLLCAGGQVLDMAKSGDRFNAGMRYVYAEHEADQSRERSLRALNANVAAGRPHSPPPFGYRLTRDENGRPTPREVDGKPMHWEPHPKEAPIFLEMVNRVLAGETIHSVYVDFSHRGVRGKRGGEMSTAHWLNLLRSPTMAGMRVHKGQIAAPGTWPGLITMEQHEQLMAIFLDPRRPKMRGSAPKYLLAGVAKCGTCGGPMKSGARHDRVYYICRDRRSPFRSDEMLEARHASRETKLADAVVLEVLHTYMADDALCEELLTALSGDNAGAADFLDQARRKEAYLQGFIESAMDPEAGISPQTLAMMERKLRPEIEALRDKARVSAAPVNSPALKFLSADDRAAHWEGLDINGQKAILRDMFDIRIYPIGQGNRPTPSSIKIRWAGTLSQSV